VAAKRSPDIKYEEMIIDNAMLQARLGHHLLHCCCLFVMCAVDGEYIVYTV
jgi:hypothetical protein